MQATGGVNSALTPHAFTRANVSGAWLKQAHIAAIFWTRIKKKKTFARMPVSARYLIFH